MTYTKKDFRKDTGVKMLFLLAVVPGIPEKFKNVSQVWNLLQLNNLKIFVAADLKMINILLGLMGHSSTYPCPYCVTMKRFLSTKCDQSRTIENINENFEKWKGNGSQEKLSKNFFNCVNKPILTGYDNNNTVVICPPPVLHITLGIVNAVHKAVKICDPVIAEQWAIKSNCKRHSQFGFTGRDCYKLLTHRILLLPDGPLYMYRKV